MDETQGSRLLSAAATARAIAAKLGVDERTARAWRRGEKPPSAAHADSLEAAYGVPLRAWHERPAEPPRASRASAPPPAGRLVADGTSQPEPSAPRGTLLDPIARLRAELERAQRELQADTTMTLANRSRLLSQMSSTTARLAKAQTVSEEAIVGSEAWGAILETIAQALAPWGAEPMRAVGLALAAEGAKAQAAGR